jgi:bifunctional oligoribonuclease and PAP phosphatase NrnA
MSIKMKFKKMKTDNRCFSKINDLIDQSGEILISGHKNPDGDSLASCLALYYLLKELGKKVSVYSFDPLPYNYMFLKGAKEVKCELPETEPDLYIITDAGSVDRVDSRLRKKMTKSESPSLLFDHHILTESVKDFYSEIYVDENACATAALIYRWAKSRGLEVNVESAEAIYAGIMSDTGGLRYGSTNRESFEIMSELIEKVSPWKVATEIYEKVPANQIKMLAEVLSEIKIIAEGKAAVVKITNKQLDKYGLTADHVDSFVNYARSIECVKLAMRFRELEENCWKVSMRSKEGIDCHVVASGFGGGGHRNAAGFIFKGSYDDALKKVEEIVNSVSK